MKQNLHQQEPGLAVRLLVLQIGVFALFAGDVTVTLVMFSGVPDPEWTVTSTDPDYLDVQTRLNNAIQNGLVYQPEDLPAVLGYKGFLVREHDVKKKKTVLQGEAEERLIVGPVTVELQKRLFKTMPKGILPETLRENITKVIASGVVKPQVAQKKTKRYAPPFVTAPWVTRNRQLNNNCYNYATTVITGTFARPGRASNNPFNAIAPLNVLLSAMGDGLVPLLPGGPVPVNPPLPNQNHVVALVVWPGKCPHKRT